jgi:hypothetical protein
MTNNGIHGGFAVSAACRVKVDIKFEVVVSPVWDVHCSEPFYRQLGWGLNPNCMAADNDRVIQFKPS